MVMIAITDWKSKFDLLRKAKQNQSSQGFVQSMQQIKSLCQYAYRIMQSFLVLLAFCQQKRVCA